MKRRFPRGLTLLFGALLLLSAVGRAQTTGVNLTLVPTEFFPYPIGLDWQPAGPYADQLIMSVYYPTGTPMSFAHIDRHSGTVGQWSTDLGWNNEIYFATVRPGQPGGWFVGDVYSAEGDADGLGDATAIAKFSSDGTLLDAHFATMPGETKQKRGGVVFDQFGVAGYDLIVVASNDGAGTADVYRINSDKNSANHVTHVATLDEHLEGITTIPNDPNMYGPWAGKILAAAEFNNEFVTIDPDTGVIAHFGTNEMGLPEIKGEDLWVIPANSTFYGLEYGDVSNANRLWKADASQWVGKVGRVLWVQEYYGQMYTIYWDPTANSNAGGFISELVNPGSPDGSTGPGHYEHITFVPESSIGDFVWLDLNANGQQDLGEPGIAGVTVKLLDATGTTVLQTTTTDANGKYNFAVVAGTYVVQFVTPAGVYNTLTSPDAAPDGSDSDANQVTGKTGTYTVNSGDHIDTVDGGLLPIDLSVTKAVNNSTPAVGATVTFTVTVSNAAGLSTATGVALKDVLPVGLSYVSSSATVGSYSNVSGTWTVGTLASGATATLTINATVNVVGTFTNVAEVSAANQYDLDSTPGNASSVHEDDDASVTLASVTRNVQHSVTLRKSLIPASDTGRFDLRINTVVVPNQGDGGQVQVPMLAGAAVSMGEIANVANGASLSNYTSSLSCIGASVPSSSTTSGSFTMPDNDVLCTLTNTRKAAGLTTYTQGGWGAPPNGNNPGALLKANFAAVYPSGVTIGGTKTLKFTSAAAIEAFLPAGGKAAVLTASATNPTSSSAGVFAGQVLALRLSVSFSAAGLTPAGLGAMKIASGPQAGQTVNQILTLANSVLGGGALPSGLTISGLNDIVDKINNNFDGGTTNGGYLVP